MRRLTAQHERIFDDLRSSLEDSDDLDWAEAVEDAMNYAWDGLLKLGDPS